MALKAMLTGRGGILAIMLLSLLGGVFALLASSDPALAEGRKRAVRVPSVLGPDLAPGKYQVIFSTIGDPDCFGYGLPAHVTSAKSPCGTLPYYPIQVVTDDPQTDLLLDCNTGWSPTVTYNHTFTIPQGATILGAVWLMNIGGVEYGKGWPTSITLDGGTTLLVPNTGQFGTTLVSAPILPPLTLGLLDGQFTATVTRGIDIPTYSACDDIFVDFSALAIVVSTP